MELNDTSMNTATRMSMAQGGDYADIHRAQHGGMAPVGYTGVLDESLRGAARVLPLDASAREIQGLSDQTGGRRKKARKARKAAKKSRKGRKGSRKTRKGSKGSRKSRQNEGTRRRRQTGGMRELGYMETDAPGMLLPPSLAAKALSTMSPEWKLAENPSSFAPKGF
jgi:hypothetical protein